MERQVADSRFSWRMGFMQLFGAVLAILILGSSVVEAFQFDWGPDTKGHLDTTVKYSNMSRVGERMNRLVSDPNTDDGDRNFDRGLVSNRLDLKAEMELQYRNMFGARVSGAAWYDTVYNRSNANDSPATVNSYSVPYDEFANDTRDLHGRYIELLDAFIFGNGNLSENVQGSFRLGRHTLLWGESLFMAGNGISYGQAPIDAIRLLSVPGTQAKELFMPVTQASFQVQPSSKISFAAFYQFEWRQWRLPAAGSYVSDVDLLDEGGERLFPPGAPPGFAFFRGNDLEAKNSGQWGVSTRYRETTWDVEYGLYYYRFHDRMPQLYITPGAVDPTTGFLGQYTLVYPEDIDVYGASFSTQIGAANVSGEVHMRRNMPLKSNPQIVLPGVEADNDKQPLYAVGNTVHANLSGIYFLPPSWLWQGGTFLGEIGWNRYTSITRNATALDPTRTRDAWGFRTIFEPAYYAVFPSLDLTVPIGLGYNPKGKSAVVQKFNGGANEGGDLSVGLTATYQQVWKSNLTFNHYFGSSSTQTLRDRDNIAFYVQRTF